MTWRPAACISEMLAEANELAPHRDKSSDGIIGDASHQASQSDHNPDSRGIVHAIDLTEDPQGGWNCGVRTEEIRLAKDRRVLYVIFNKRWFHGNRGMEWDHTPWEWEPYHGSSPHAEHMHVSVEYGKSFENDVHPWFGPTQEEDLTPEQAKMLAEVHDALGLRKAGNVQGIDALTKVRGDGKGVSYPAELDKQMNEQFNELKALLEQIIAGQHP